MANLNPVKIIVLAIALFNICSVSAFAQLSPFNNLNTYIQSTRVGLVDEFFDRFNGKNTHPDIPSTQQDSRLKNLLMLFDGMQFSSKDDARYVEAEVMMKKVKDEGICINYTDSMWAALAHCRGLLNGRSVKFNIILTVQHRKGNMYKWVISNADSDIIDVSPTNINDRIMLLPDDHETNFMSLRRLTAEQPCDILNFMVEGFEYHPTSVFVYLIYTKQLKIEYVEDLEFIFTQIPGYIFHVKYFERESSNAGWLISDFYETSNENKSAFLHSLKPLFVFSSDGEMSESEDIISDTNYPDSVFGIDNISMKKIYDKRLNERILLIKDYIDFIQKKDARDLKNMYERKLSALFAPNAKLHVHRGEKTDTLTINEACEKIFGSKQKSIVLDSIRVPIWNDAIISLEPNIYMVKVNSYMRGFSEPEYNNVLFFDDYPLYIYKEETEDGSEWLPLFGDLSIIVK